MFNNYSSMCKQMLTSLHVFLHSVVKSAFFISLIVASNTAFSSDASSLDSQIVSLINGLGENSDQDYLILKDIEPLISQRLNDSTELTQPSLVKGTWNGAIETISVDEEDSSGNIVAGRTDIILRSDDGEIYLHLLTHHSTQFSSTGRYACTGYRVGNHAVIWSISQL